MLNASTMTAWEVITVHTTFDEVDRMPSMKHMGCFNHYSNNDLVILFGGGQGPSLSNRAYCIDLAKGTLNKYAKLSKADRFPHHVYFTKGESRLYVFGEFYLHTFSLDKEKWLQESIPLNQNAVHNGS